MTLIVVLRSPMTRVVKVLTAAAKNKWKQHARRRELRQRTGYDGPVNLPIGNYRFTPFLPSNPIPSSSIPSLRVFLGNHGCPLRPAYPCFTKPCIHSGPHELICMIQALLQACKN